MSEYEAGRETDALVAERLEPKPWSATVGDWRRTFKITPTADYESVFSPGGQWEANIGFDAEPEDRPVEWQPAHEFSTDIAAAWALVETMRAGGRGFALLHGAYAGCQWEATLGAPVGRGYAEVQHADTAPLAITRAFLANTEPTP